MNWLSAHLRDRRVAAAVAIVLLPMLVVVGAAGRLLLAPPGPDPEAVAATATLAPSPTSTATPEPTPTPTPVPVPQALEDGRLTVLVLGSDSDVARRARGKGFLTDAITVVSVKANGRNPVIVSLPRDTVDVPLPDGTIWSQKINALAFETSPEVTRDAMALLLDIEIDHFVMVDMDDFRNLVDAVGGVKLNVPYALYDGRCAIPAGRQHLDGAQTLCYARHRITDSDYARAGRHQQVLLALRHSLLAGRLDLPALISGLASLRTDVAMEELAAYADIVRRSTHAKPSRLVLAPPTYTTFVGLSGARGYISVPNIPVIQQAVADLIRG